MTTPATPLTLTIVHRLPGRLRLRLSHPLHEPTVLTAHVREHEGVLSVTYTPVTGSVLITSDPQQVTQEEIVLRVGLATALDHGAVPVRVHSCPDRPHLAPSVVLSGALLAAVTAVRFGGRQRPTPWLDLTAGFATLWAVLDHAWAEIRERGVFDPEAASLFLLVAAMLRGSTLSGALLTWLSTFGRHLIEAPRSAVEVTPVPLGGAGGPSHEVAVAPVQAEPGGVPLLRVVPSLLWFALTGARGGMAGGLLEEMREVSRLHHKVLEGLSASSSGFPLHVR